jgi:intracellular multiplication protein IcmP
MAAPQAGGGQPDNSMGIIWGVVGLFAALAAIWFFFKTQIIYFYLSIKLFEVNILNSLLNDKYRALESMMITAMHNSNKLTFPDVIALGEGVGNVMRFPLAAILVICGFIIYFGSSAGIYKRNYSMKEFLKLEKDNWPHVYPVLGLDLIKEDINKGPWAMALQPVQFCKRFNLLDEVRAERREGMSRKDREKISVVLRRGESNRIFAMQLGPLWGGPDRLPPHARALLAVFAARTNADSKVAEAVLKRLNLSCRASQLDMTGVDELLKKHLGTKAVQKVIASHAYVSTVMASMLESARTDGVQASADFLWLKVRDRQLWYVLNTVGRQTPFVEVAGVFAHWKAEREAGRKLLVPVVESATNALEMALQEIIYSRDE